MALSYSRDTITHTTTGVKTMTCGFQPVKAKIKVTFAPGANDTKIHMSEGTTDGTNQVCDTDTYHDSTHAFERRFTDRVVSIQEWTGAAWSEVLRANFDSFTATEFKYNVTVAGANAGNYQFHREVEG